MRNIKRENEIIKKAKQKLTLEYVLKANNYCNDYDWYIQHFRDVKCGLSLEDNDITREFYKYVEDVCYCPEGDKLMYKLEEKFIKAMLSHCKNLSDITDNIVDKIYKEGQTPTCKMLRVLGQRLQEEFHIALK